MIHVNKVARKDDNAFWGISKYAINFSEQRIPMDKSIIVELGHGELKELGVDLLGDRLAILKCAKVAYKLDNTKL